MAFAPRSLRSFRTGNPPAVAIDLRGNSWRLPREPLAECSQRSRGWLACSAAVPLTDADRVRLEPLPADARVEPAGVEGEAPVAAVPDHSAAGPSPGHPVLQLRPATFLPPPAPVGSWAQTEDG